LLLIQVPYIGPYLKLKRYLPWLPIHFEAPRHLYDFSPRVLAEYFCRSGLLGLRAEIARPYASPTRFGAALIWCVKGSGLFLYYLTGGRYIHPFCSAIALHGVKSAAPEENAPRRATLSPT
jgi:hypothetical protein